MLRNRWKAINRWTVRLLPLITASTYVVTLSAGKKLH